MNKNEIIIKIKNEQDLYIPFNPEKELKKEVIDYIGSKIEEMTSGEEIRIHIISEEAVDAEDIRQAFSQWSYNIQLSLNREKWKNRKKQAWMFCIGVVFIALSVALQGKVSMVVYTVLSTIGAFSMWEAAAIWIVENPENRIKKRLIRRITNNMKFLCTTEGSDNL